ncbi:PhaM family polyhydroxyalkanoate granule multifunctional regulatory protein [Variovorax sp. GT1P44]|uniref:PhaM family polyhydroxyalkanoate granule multifunctional regulatory protein n=1 Tax=Variovorax sp. GT1P44 TaxID=3443742 RepID=UPI003F45F0F1
MSDTSKPFAFSQFVPGFDFLRNLASGSASAGASAVPGMPSLSSWVAPTLSVEEVDKRIQELKTVQYWLEQNGHALKATIQALEVQKMTLSTLRGMNVRMEDLASVFTRQASAPTPAPMPAPAPSFRAAPPEPEPEVEEEEDEDVEVEADEQPAAKSKASKAAGGASADGAGVVDPLQWWGALTQQFQQIAASAMQDASQLKVPAMAEAVGKAMGAAPAKATRKPAAAAASKKTSTGRNAAAGKSSAPARKRAR